MRSWRGLARWMVSPKLAAISTGSSKGVPISNEWMKLASTNWVIWTPNPSPGQALLPYPNGPNSKFWPLTSTCFWLPKNLSGLNSKGSAQTRGSVCIFQRLVMRRVPAATWYPLSVQSWLNSRIPDSGPAGYNLNVSFTTAWRYTNLLMSDSSTSLLFPTWMSSSSCIFLNASRLFSKNEIAHVSVTVTVSLPPVIRLCCYREFK